MKKTCQSLQISHETERRLSQSKKEDDDEEDDDEGSSRHASIDLVIDLQLSRVCADAVTRNRPNYVINH